MMPDPDTRPRPENQEVTNAVLGQKIDNLTNMMRDHIAVSKTEHDDHEMRIRSLEAGQTERKIRVENIECDIKELKNSKADASDVIELHNQVRTWNIANSVGAFIAAAVAVFFGPFKGQP